jgi:DNA-binding NarL/FixJ family response regulator
MINVAITDDHPIVIDGLLTAFRDEHDITITGTYNSGAALLRGLHETVPDVLLLDLQLPDTNGTELVPVVLQQYPSVHIIILSGIESSPYIKEMLQKGCKGYLLKSNTGKSILMSAVRDVYEGNIYIETSIKDQLLHEMLITKRKLDKINPKITQREQEVLKLIMQELNNQEIADTLFISLRTVETHRYNLLQKLNAKNTAGLLRIARQMGLG